MFTAVALATFSLLGAASAQQVGTSTSETHPKLSWSKCTRGGSCQNQGGAVVLDSNWRWTHKTGDYTNCYDGSEWVTAQCPDPQTCAKNCAVEGADYSKTYGITASSNSLTLKFVTEHEYGTNVGSRVYLMNSGDTAYEMFKLKNKEFTFDVDVSGLGCGLNGALYFVEMDADGGVAKYPNNKAGAKYGTGYCDAQCPHDIKWINGEANTIDWNASETDPNAGTGKYGTCCAEMDIWEANSMANAYTPHGCTKSGQYRCDGNECGDGDNRYGGICDKDGCDFNPFRMGNKEFYGKGKTVDTSKKFTVVTQFITADNTTTGPLSEIRRIYVQGGKVIPNSVSNFEGLRGYDSITEKFCGEQKTLFGDKNDFQTKGGLKPQGDSFDKGNVLVMSVWADHAAHMLWLDSDYPLNKSPSEPGVSRGACATSSGVPADVEKEAPNSQVIFSNIKFGDIGSTYTA